MLSGGDWLSEDSFRGYYKTKINFICSPNVTIETSTPSFVAVEKNLYLIEFKTSTVCKFVDVKCDVRSGHDYYDLRPVSLSTGVL